MRLGHAEKIWLLLLALTALGAWFAETGHAGWPLSLLVAALIAAKGRLVIDHYMEMKTAHARLRRALHAFVTLMPLLVLLTHGFGDFLREITTLP